eukprot:CAMPEP_0172840974 /NCGR_PEP_ID=MMETSP1075-20121228/29695_1 /TAXON_ID=2916 /ORGANISM="Ceratium fusus, Strain PA161109" /LENGTH=98 /DNA_ID=CAMNT_0013684893 /DNA_START=143 /DNA_END=437 /DNA_ORIENTATION=-
MSEDFESTAIAGAIIAVDVDVVGGGVDVGVDGDPAKIQGLFRIPCVALVRRKLPVEYFMPPTTLEDKTTIPAPPLPAANSDEPPGSTLQLRKHAKQTW